MARTTTAIIIKEANAPPTLETVAIDALRPDEALVEIHAVGVCHTDLGCIDGSLPAQFPCVFGHEGGGVVVEAGSEVKHVGVDDRVLLSYAHCNNCASCNDGHPAYCLNFLPHNFGYTRVDGSFALSYNGEKCHSNFFGQSSFMRQAVVHVSSLVKVAPDTDLALLAPLGCGLQTGAGCVFNTLDVKAGSSVVVFGVGSVGMAAVMGAKIRKAGIIIAVDLQASRLELAKELGATHSILGSDTDVVEQIQKLCPPNGANYAVECTGVPKVVETAVDCLGTRGRAATIGAPTPGKRASVDVFSHLIMGREYVGCCEGDSVTSKLIPYLIEEHKKGNFPIEKIITYYDVKDAATAFADTKRGKSIKAVLKWT